VGKSPDPEGKLRENDWKGKPYSGRNFLDFSGDFPTVSRENSQKMVIIHQEMISLRQKMTGIHQKKTRRLPVRILLPCSIDFRCFPAGTGPYFLTWVL
jgi:hypothetical protein